MIGLCRTRQSLLHHHNQHQFVSLVVARHQQQYYSSSSVADPRSRSIDGIRDTFLKYFERNGHKRVDSASLIPHTDNTLLFTNSGMVQFKNCFTGVERPPQSMCTTVQRCVRAGGKHNDLENVGYTARHHTFFEMLGNFSFGGYAHFKRDAIKHAWQLLTVDFGLPVDRLAISVLHGDEESADIWRNEIGLPSEKIMYKGEADNFWSMGDGAGPCGPCSEIFWDQGCEVDGDRYLEIWNLVFMQYFRDDKGALTPLETPCVDTGMGLERMAAVMQHVESNYDTDLFVDLIGQIKQLASSSGHAQVVAQDDTVEQLRIQTAYRVVADHLRATSFLIADGVIPSATGRGYVLRKIIRRALSYGKSLGFSEPFLHLLFPYLSKRMATTYPHLESRATEVVNVIYNEELTFFKAIERGMPHLQDLLQSKRLDDWHVFNLFNTFGLPLEISEVRAKQANLRIDMDKVNQLINEMKEKSKSTWKKDKNPIPDIVTKWKNEGIEPDFTGYSCTKNNEAKVLQFHFNPELESTAYISVDSCPFYGSAGGQVGDVGHITANGNKYRVIDCVKPYDKGLVMLLDIDPKQHRYSDVERDLKQGSRVSCEVDARSRQQTAIHHTATHLLQAALRSVLNSKTSSVVQAGSYVGPDTLRFDFTHPNKMSAAELSKVEQWINQVIAQDMPVATNVMSYAEASQSDAVQLFSEKYGDKVRVVDVLGKSKELCGGTHVRRTGELQHFKIISESSIAAGTRRIEAVAGSAAIAYLANHSSMLANIAERLDVPMQQLERQVDSLVTSKREMERQVLELQHRLALASLQTTNGMIDGQNTHIHLINQNIQDKKTLQDIGNLMAQKHSDSAHIILSQDGKILCTLGQQCQSKPSVSADKMLKQMFTIIGCGKGGGSKQMAQASLGANRCLDQQTIDHIYRWANCPTNQQHKQ
ncbi:hypothetical protein SAMD00019534_051040 [Acytostelium subglobosum LB1]|uniref:hypothetical protein n=1 Tax=Acytostelium subglobosum LB1 TaxID=1410327 RepID=UPI0006450C84|nr:hypothetical protein SAMD00019534_051040 [Acytostelium subglobosum LB1]GAM21929.1 hypothetical protein SAMD00019534_051040 [Acytostelium subglobosum LB1]|eukprot:XP_012755029.1 hypothetical protein SAMD00019534_051040 [Acytostelium subglobosum LB1]